MTKLTKAISAVCLMLSTGPIIAAAPVPATQPVSPMVVPTTQPAASDIKVLILPFSPIQASDPEWIGKAVQQTLAADLSRSHNGASAHPITDTTIVTTTAQALAAGQKASVKYVVFGSYQVLDPNLRITGQIVETDTGRVIAGLKSTGTSRDLFEMQDTLAFQCRWGLGMDELANKKVAALPTTAPSIEAQGPVQVGEANRYPGSNLSDAVNNGQSLIDQNSAAGQAYRESYFYDPYADYYPSGYGYYNGGYSNGGLNGYFFNEGFAQFSFPFCFGDRFHGRRHREPINVPQRSDAGRHDVWRPMNGLTNINGYTPMTLRSPVRTTLQSPVLMTQQGGATGGRTSGFIGSPPVMNHAPHVFNGGHR